MSFAKERNRLIMLIASILTVGFFATTLLSHFVSSSSVRDNIVQQQLPLTSDNIYVEIQRDLLKPIQVAKQMADNTFLMDWALNGEGDLNAMTRYLAKTKSEYSANTSFFISERTRNYYHAGGILKKVDPTEEKDQWYYSLSKESIPYRIDIDTDKANKGVLTLFLNFKVLDTKGNYFGVTGIGITLNRLAELVKFYGEKYQRRVLFFNEDGTQSFGNAELPAALHKLADMPGLGQHAQTILKSQAQDTRLTYRLAGETIHAHTRYIPELKWFLVVEQNESAALGSVQRTLGINLVLSIIVTFLAISVTLYTVNLFQRRLELVASTDNLTGLANKEKGEILLAQAIKDANRFNQAFCLVIIDLDHFKNINDTCGHLMGDQVLRKLSDLLRATVRKNDLVVRWGGEEFLVLLKNCPIGDGIAWSESLRQVIACSDFQLGSDAVKVTASLGVSEYARGMEWERLFEETDKALYHAKALGRNQVQSSFKKDRLMCPRPQVATA